MGSLRLHLKFIVLLMRMPEHGLTRRMPHYNIIMMSIMINFLLGKTIIAITGVSC